MVTVVSKARATLGLVLTAFMVMLSTAVLTLTATVQTAVNLLAGTVLVVPGTGTPNPDGSTNYSANALNYYVVPGVNGNCGPVGQPSTCTTQPVPYIAQFWPFPFEGWGGLSGAKWNVSVESGVSQLTSDLVDADLPNNNVVVFGYSQGATVVSQVKNTLRNLDGGSKDNLYFVLIGNPNRPNGGLFERLAILGTVPILDATFGQPTPTDTGLPGQINTTDIAFQYDGVADFPTYPINLLADLNALAGFQYVHGTYLDPRGRPTTPEGALAYGYSVDEVQDIVAGCTADPSSSTNCQQHGDTIYVTLPARSLPIMQPFLDLGAATGTSALVKPVVAFLQPMTQTLIETGYDRSDYGTPTPFKIVPLVNPITLASDLIQDVPEGFNAAVATVQTGTIPDLPPSWGSTTSTLTLDAKQGAPAVEAATPKELQLKEIRAQLKLPQIIKPSKAEPQNATGNSGSTKANLSPLRDFHPVRDLTTAIKKTFSKPETAAAKQDSPN